MKADSDQRNGSGLGGRSSGEDQKTNSNTSETDEHVADRLATFKLKLLQEKMAAKEKQQVNATQQNYIDVANIPPHMHSLYMQQQLDRKRQLFQQLRRLHEAEYGNYGREGQDGVGPQAREGYLFSDHNNFEGKGSDFSFQKQMEMILLQNSQMQQMLMTALLKGAAGGGAGMGMDFSNGNVGGIPDQNRNGGQGGKGKVSGERPNSLHTPESAYELKEGEIRMGSRGNYLNNGGHDLKEVKDLPGTFLKGPQSQKGEKKNQMETERVETAQTQIDASDYPYPLRLRQIAYAIIFCNYLRKKNKINKQRRKKVAEEMKVIGKDAQTALVRFFVEDGSAVIPIQSIVRDSSLDLNVVEPKGLFKTLKENDKKKLTAIQGMIDCFITSIESLQVTYDGDPLELEFFPFAVRLVSDNVTFPKDYFWDVEKENMNFNSKRETANITVGQARMLLLNYVIFRVLIANIILTPADCDVVRSRPDREAEKNLKILATILHRISRGAVAGPESQYVVPLAIQNIGFVFTDEDMKFYYKKLESFIDKSRKRIYEWSNRFLRDLREYAERLLAKK
eukprot:Nk52_evm5s353 gene=Nk52_evmTU5s353